MKENLYLSHATKSHHSLVVALDNNNNKKNKFPKFQMSTSHAQGKKFKEYITITKTDFISLISILIFMLSY